MITRYIIGDITETELKYIAHGVNCQNKMGSGVAKALFTAIPAVKREYHDYCRYDKPEDLLGRVNIVPDYLSSRDITVFNMFTQLNYGYDGNKYVNYGAIVRCFDQLANKIKWMKGKTIAIPKIGCGLAGGDWNIVEQLINDTVGDELEIWVYELEEKKSSGKNDLG